MELYKAHRQWATRPADETFNTFGDLYKATKAYAATAADREYYTHELITEPLGDEVALRRIGGKGVPAEQRQAALMSNWAFKQLCGRVQAPPEYLGKLPAVIASQCLNVGLKNYADRREMVNLLFHVNGGMMCRAFTSNIYERIWNWEVAERLLALEQRGWEPARPDIRTTATDHAALYASDHDMFAFARLQNVHIQQPVAGAKSAQPIYRGLIYENSEVGAGKLRVTRFLYNEMCGNHIIWGAQDVVELAVRHVGKVRDRMMAFDVAIKQYANESASDEQAVITRATQKRIAATKDEVLDALFGLRLKSATNLGIPRTTLEKAYDAVLPAQDGDPRTVWGMVQGITRHSQQTPFADDRVVLDRGAGKLLEMVDRF